MSRRSVLIILLVIAISISPRIRLGMLGSRSLDVRYEDFLLLGIMILWFIKICVENKRIYLTPIFKPLLIYLFFATFSTYLGTLLGWIEPLRAFFFYLKEIEYFLIAFIVANFIKDSQDMKVAVYTLVLCALANGFYASSYVMRGIVTPYYGSVATIGEPSKFSTGGYLSISLIFSILFFGFIKEKKIKLLSLASVIFCLVGLIKSQSRASTFGVIVAFLVFAILVFREKRSKSSFHFKYRYFFIGAGIIFLIVLGIFSKKISIEHLTDIRHIESSVDERIAGGYVFLWDEFAKSPIFGFGKDACSVILGGTGTGEAHNHYLRILIEMGIIGLILFLYMLFSIVKMCFKVYKNSSSGLSKAISMSCLLTVVILMIASFVQDAFTPVKVNEMLWVLVGLTASAYKIEKI